MATTRVRGRTDPGQRAEAGARLLLLFVLTILPLAIVFARLGNRGVTLHATMAESGGWQPGHLSVPVGQPLHLRLTSDDVVHGFAVRVGPDGQKVDSPEVEVKPGQVTELSLTFDQPGTYTYTCTRWCGPNHWRMRGTIEVGGGASGAGTTAGDPPLYLELGLDIDAPHPPPVVPERTPSATAGAALAASQPLPIPAREDYMTQSPAELWLVLRDLAELAHLGDDALWDAVAYLWREQTTEEALALGEDLYHQNCAACHGEGGAGDGVFAASGAEDAGSGEMRGHKIEPATDFTDPALLGASNALLQGKVLRGGMGTGMPAWGTLFTDEELQALLAYLWTFQFPDETP